MLFTAHAIIAAGVCAISGFQSAQPVVIADIEPNDTKDQLVHVPVPAVPFYLVGKLEKRTSPDCQPDTFMVLFDKHNNFVQSDDNGAIDKGNGWASGIYGIGDGTGFINNGDGSRSLRVGVTGRADGFDGNFNGFNQNSSHLQFGGFTVFVKFYDGGGAQIGETREYVEEFTSGAEAFYLNFIVPMDAVSADVCIDNTVGEILNCNDVDFYCLENLVPLCEYCITTIGGLDCECVPTDTLLGWFDKNMGLIDLDDNSGPVVGYSRLCVTADIDGRSRIAVTGTGDEDFDGLLDGQLLIPGVQSLDRAPVECPEFLLGHGICGCYTLDIRVSHPHDGGSEGEENPETLIENAMSHGDINMDGMTNSSDLGLLLGNFGWISTR